MDDNYFTKLLENVASKTVLAIFGIIGTGITIYAFFQKSEVELRYEVTANTNVLDFNADVSKLEVFYDSTNLKQTKENLRIYTIKVINIGNKDLVKEFYDDNDPLGIAMTSGQIIERPEIIETSSDYIKRNLKISTYKKDTITFSQVIVESNEFFILKILVLHKTDSLPKIQSIGKVAGQKNILVVNAADIKKEEPSFIPKTLQGNLWVQLARLVAYFGTGLFIIYVIVTISEKFEKRQERKRKLKTLERFKSSKTYEYTRMDDAIFDRYKQKGSSYLREISYLINDEIALNKNYSKLTEGLKSKEFKRFRHSREIMDFDLIGVDTWALINEMINDGFIIKEGDKLRINQAMRDSLRKFISFLKDNKEFDRLIHYGGSDRTIIESDYESVSDETPGN